MKPVTVVILAVIFWVSAISMFVIGSTPHNSVFRLASIPDALVATVFTFIAVRKWVNGES